MDAHGGLFLTQCSTTVFGHAYLRTFDLPASGGTAKLCHQFMNLRQPRCPDGMTAGLQTATDINRNFSAEGGGAAFGKSAAFTFLPALMGRSFTRTRPSATERWI